MDTCSECREPVYARRLCSKHYQRARAEGALPASVVVDRPCAHCGQLMVDRKSARAKFCTPACKEAARSAALHEAMLQRRGQRTCDMCQADIPATMSSKARFCSSDCTTAWHNRQRVNAKKESNLARRGPCRGCGAEIPETRRSHAQYCSRDCMARDVRARTYDSERARDLNRRYLYGITSDEFDALLAAQGGGCGICGTTDWPGRYHQPHLDHCHETKRARGVLCTSCNQGLGRFRDEISRLISAIIYLTDTFSESSVAVDRADSLGLVEDGGANGTHRWWCRICHTAGEDFGSEPEAWRDFVREHLPHT